MNVFAHAASVLIQPVSLLFMGLGLILGTVVGIVPGIGGIFALAILMPVVFNMALMPGVIFLVSILSVVSNAGAVTAILIGVPGTPTNAATILDGFPMTKNGQAGRALGAGLTASAMGGVMGALVLLAILPVMRPLILAFGAPEMFMMAVLGISFVAVLSRGSLAQGVIAAVLGILLATVGYDPITGITRYTFGSLYLYNGIGLIPATLGLFALPELVGMYAGSDNKAAAGLVAEPSTSKASGVLLGVRDAFRHWFLVVRSGMIGAFIGIIPGLGGDTATFLAYGHSQQTSKRSQDFGKGVVEGVIAPQAADNAKEGGSLVPTLGFGIPGSASMAILYAAFVVLGLQPGLTMIKNQSNLIMVIIILIAVTNVIGSVLILLAAKWLVKIANISAKRLVPWVVMFMLTGAYLTNYSYVDVFVTVAVGALGLVLKRYGYPRVCLLLAFILAKPLQVNFWQSYELYGLGMFNRPIVLVLAFFIVVMLVTNVLFGQRTRSETTVDAG